MDRAPHRPPGAVLVWASLLVVPVAFGLVVGTVRDPAAADARFAPLFFWIALAASAFDLVLAWILPHRIGPPRAAPETVALTRLLVAWALCEAAAIFPLVAYMITGDARLPWVSAAGLVALASLFPGERRWRAALPGPAEPARMVR
jgi:hypothetical protein